MTEYKKPFVLPFDDRKENLKQLLIAVRKGQLVRVRAFFTAMEIANNLSAWGGKGLRIAAENGHLEITKLFLSVEEGRKKATAWGNDALRKSLKNAHLEVGQQLLNVPAVAALEQKTQKFMRRVIREKRHALVYYTHDMFFKNIDEITDPKLKASVLHSLTEAESTLNRLVTIYLKTGKAFYLLPKEVVRDNILSFLPGYEKILHKDALEKADRVDVNILKQGPKL